MANIGAWLFTELAFGSIYTCLAFCSEGSGRIPLLSRIFCRVRLQRLSSIQLPVVYGFKYWFRALPFALSMTDIGFCFTDHGGTLCYQASAFRPATDQISKASSLLSKSDKVTCRGANKSLLGNSNKSFASTPREFNKPTDREDSLWVEQSDAEFHVFNWKYWLWNFHRSYRKHKSSV